MVFAFVSVPCALRCVRGEATAMTAPRRRPRASTMDIAVGTKVRVKTEVIMYHYPKQRNEEVNVEGLEGTVSQDLREKEGIEMTATKAYLVRFDDPKFAAHFSEDELELL